MAVFVTFEVPKICVNATKVICSLFITIRNFVCRFYFVRFSSDPEHDMNERVIDVIEMHSYCTFAKNILAEYLIAPPLRQNCRHSCPNFSFNRGCKKAD